MDYKLRGHPQMSTFSWVYIPYTFGRGGGLEIIFSRTLLTFWPDFYYFHGIFGTQKMLMCTLFWRGEGRGSQKVYSLYTHENVNIYGRPHTFLYGIENIFVHSSSLSFKPEYISGHHIHQVETLFFDHKYIPNISFDCTFGNRYNKHYNLVCVFMKHSLYILHASEFYSTLCHYNGNLTLNCRILK